MAKGSDSSLLILTDAPVLSSLQRIQASSLASGCSADAADVSTCCSVSSLSGIPSASYSRIVSLSEEPGHHSQKLLTELGRLLQPGGSLSLQEPVSSRTPHSTEQQALGPRISSLSSKASLERSLLLSGYASWTDGTPLECVGLHRDWSGVTPAAVGSMQGPLLQPLLLKAVKPEWSSGASFTLKRKTAAPVPTSTNGVTPAAPSAAKALAPKVPAPQMPAPAAWKVNGAEDDEDELVDEDALLTAEDMQIPVLPGKQSGAGCDPAKPMRKACKNCNCGRAEMEEKAAAEGGSAEKLTLDQLENPQSACGSCGLGDAFRCAGCPYRGLPPFKLGEKISLGSAVLSADV